MGSADQDLLQMINGYRVSQAIYVIATLHIPDHLSNGPLTSEHLAALTGSHPETLYRVLRALAAVGIFREGPNKQFELTSLGEDLRTGVPGSRAAWARQTARPAVWQAWGHLLEAVRTGDSAFASVHGTDIWEYRAANPKERMIFDVAMREGSERAATAVLDAYDFGSFPHIVDIGGGDGALLARILARFRNTSGTLFDQTQVLAAASDVLRAAGVADRCEVVPGNFFEQVPRGGDAYLLKFILHDWQDAPATSILQTCRGAMNPEAKLLVIERLVGPPNEGRDSKFSDLNMFVNVTGRERSQEEFTSLFADAGFILTRVIPLGELSILEASVSQRFC
jgi:hypothetical protein